MKIACLTFTSAGEKLAQKIQLQLEYEVNLFTKQNYKENLDRIFQEFEGIIFISSTGIAVRIASPYLKSKASDPAILVIDDQANFVISLVSGHLGGANALTLKLAVLLGSQPVITTASDNRGFEAIDLFAQRNKFGIESLEDCKLITAMMLEEKKLQLVSEVDCKIKYPHLVDSNPDGYIFVSSENKIESNLPTVILRPKNLFVGLGCRKGKTKAEILFALEKVFSENNLSLNSIASFGTVELKKDEAGMIEAAKHFNLNLNIFTNQEIEKVQHLFPKSELVFKTVGVTSVSEPCAYLQGGEVIVPKTRVNGVTVAVSRKK